MPKHVVRTLVGSLLALVLLAGGCGDDGDDTGAADTESTAGESAPSGGDESEGTAPTGDSTDPTGEGSTEPGGDDLAPTSQTAPTTTSAGPPATQAPAPEVLGTPTDLGMEYPDPVTCAEVEAVFPALPPETVSALSQGDGSSIWLAIDKASLSLDAFSPTEPDRTLVRVRGGLLDLNAEPLPEELPALGADDSYATVTVTAEGTIGDCVEGPVVG